MSVFDHTKFDVLVKGLGYRIRAITKAEVNPFIPRFGSGDQKESEFDLLRSKTLRGFAGGILQREWDTESDNSIYGSEGLFPRYNDGVLYPVNTPVQQTHSMGKALVTANCTTSQYYFRALTSFNLGNNQIIRRDLSGTEVVLTIPAGLANALNGEITSMVVWNNQLWITNYVGLYYMDLGTTTVSSVGMPTSDTFRLMVVYRGALYGTNGFGGGSGVNPNVNCKLYKYTGSTTTAAFTLVGDTGLNVNSFESRLVAFSGRIFLTRFDGLYSYDGVAFNPVDDTTQNIDLKNFRHATVLKGYLYYFMPDGFYRFNGALIEKLYDAAEIGFPVDVCAGKNRLWLFYANSAAAGSSRYDKSMGYDYSTGYSVDGNILVFDGKAMFGYRRTTTTAPNPVDFSGQNNPDSLYWFNNILFLYGNFDHDGYYYTIDTDEVSITGSKPWKIVTSVYDGDFPMIDKNYENLEAVLDGIPASDQDITVEYRISGFDSSAGWATFGTLKSLTRLQEYAFKGIPAGLVYRRIQLRLTGTTAAGYGIAKLILRYLLAPDFKWQWTVTLACYGDNSLEPLVLKDGTNSTASVGLLRGNLYDARASDIPITFCDIDQVDLNGDHNATITTITLYTTDLLRDRGFIKIDSEYIYYTGRTSTTLTGCIRGAMGTSGATHSAGAPVFPMYRVVVRQIQSERFELTDAINDQDQVISSSVPSDMTVVLQEV